MGGEREKKPGGGTLVQPDLSTVSGVPGKSTLAGAQPQSVKDLGVPYITNENAAPAGEKKLLTQHQRDLTAGLYQDNVLAAQSAFNTALGQIWAENLMKKDEQPSVLLTFLIEAIAAQAIVGLGAAWTLFSRGKPQDVLSVLRGEDISEPGSIITKIRSIGDGPATAAIRAAVNTGRRAALAGLPDVSKDKRETAEYLNVLGDKSATAFEHQRKDPLNIPVSDADLILLCLSYSEEMGRHTISAYKEALVSKIERFKTSEASKIGRSRRDDLFNARDSKVVWVNHSKRGKRLHYHTLDHVGKGTANIPKDVDMRDETKVSPTLTQTADFQIGPPVEREFEETAIEKHLQEWRQPPETLDIDDDRQPTPDAPRDPKDLNQFVPKNNEDFQRAGAGMDADDPRTWVPK